MIDRCYRRSQLLARTSMSECGHTWSIVLLYGGTILAPSQSSLSLRGRVKLGSPLQLMRYIRRASSGLLIVLFAGGALWMVAKLLQIVIVAIPGVE